MPPTFLGRGQKYSAHRGKFRLFVIVGILLIGEAGINAGAQSVEIKQDFIKIALGEVHVAISGREQVDHLCCGGTSSKTTTSLCSSFSELLEVFLMAIAVSP